jgi:hypothetical protein
MNNSVILVFLTLMISCYSSTGKVLLRCGIPRNWAQDMMNEWPYSNLYKMYNSGGDIGEMTGGIIQQGSFGKFQVKLSNERGWDLGEKTVYYSIADHTFTDMLIR